MKSFIKYIYVLRIKTLILSASGPILSGFLAYYYNKFNIKIFIFSIITSCMYQILSNLCNDYGDFNNNIDNLSRIDRVLKNGMMSVKDIMILIKLTIALSVMLTLITLYVSFGSCYIYYLYFGLLGLFCIIAAIFYTLGDKPYGYLAMGDLFVFIFFGLVSIIGGQFLYTRYFNISMLLPAFSIGFLCVSVLNLNNMRDLISDKNNGKITIANILGFNYSKYYHSILLYIPFLLSSIYMLKCIQKYHLYNYSFLLLLLLFNKLRINIFNVNNCNDYNKYLFINSIYSFLFCLILGMSIIL